MIRLIKADLIRLSRDALFWGGAVVMLLTGIFCVVSVYLDKNNNGNMDTACAENCAFFFTMAAVLFSAAVCSVFQSEEYSGGTISNKLVSGNSRVLVYLAQVIASFIAVAVISAAFAIPSGVLGYFLLGGFSELGTAEIFGYYAAGVFLIAAGVSFFSMMAVLLWKKSVSTAGCFIVLLLFIFATIQIKNSLSVPEYTTMFVSQEVGMVYGPNPAYPHGALRDWLDFAYDILITGQAYRLSYRCAGSVVRMIVGDTVISALSLAAGIAMFVRKDVK